MGDEFEDKLSVREDGDASELRERVSDVLFGGCVMVRVWDHC